MRFAARPHHQPSPVVHPDVGARSRPQVSAGGGPAAVAAALVVAGAVFTASPAQAARAISGPSTFFCDSTTARVAVSPPRVWATRGTEQVLWLTTLERWNSSTGQWYTYGTWRDWSTFDYFGRSVTSCGPKYANNYMRFR